MGSLFRGEKMCLAQLFVQSEAAYMCASELGEVGLVQFRDLNPNVSAFHRKFVSEVRRCDEMERKIRYVEKEVKLAGIKIQENLSFIPAPVPKAMIDLEATFEKTENELREVNQNNEVLQRNYLELMEHQRVLANAEEFFANVSIHEDGSHYPILMDEEGHGSLNRRASVTLDFVAGVIERERVPAFEQMLWRVSRGNVFLRYAEIPTPFSDPATGNEIHKFVFILFYQGSQLGYRVKRICEGFRASQYPCPEDPAERREMAQGIAVRLQDLQIVLAQMDDHRQRLLACAALNLSSWFIKVRKLKAIYHALNMFNFDVTSRCLIGECWCPVDELGTIRLALQRGTQKSGSSLPSILNMISTTSEAPTFNKTNKFTEGYQNITDAYGVATYREVNPAPFCIITFPFLFGVMFGDTGHGILLFLFGLWMVLKEQKLKYTMGTSDMFGPIYGGRYLILLMGLFSIYCGLMYNDFVSKSMNFFGSKWNTSCINDADLNKDQSLMLDPKTCYDGNPYPFGLDPVWQMADNSLNFINSLKMRLSVILGITQMTFGVFLSLINHIVSRQFHRIVLEFIPQILFMLSIFGYLVFLIFYKWFAYGPQNSDIAPSLINVLIYMFQFQVPSPPMYSSQKAVQMALVFIAVLCIPWMLFGRPIYLYVRHRLSARNRGYAQLQSSPHQLSVNSDVNEGDVEQVSPTPEEVDKPSTSSGSHSMTDDVFETSQQLQEDEFDMGEIFTLQSIHTIEYCLGCVSNTASYLRLWALSLAHAELSEVLWNMVMKNGWFLYTIEMYPTGAMSYVFMIAGGIELFFVFATWAEMTVAILIMMEGLSAFLHTLRLHWIEFQNKFYGGEGYLFAPFSLVNLEAEE
ncbi:V-type proton ATPase 116 kDa subunit a 1-like [Diadema antillarum]|uniref:V-type proton ATPase 116 kDa subunit a 1-like n=1 Tax=Diadema antillarum TaxID=105358 RepID=UPI003A83FCC8